MQRITKLKLKFYNKILNVVDEVKITQETLKHRQYQLI